MDHFKNVFVLNLQWNNHGYDVAKIFGNKFTHISPVWLQITPQGAENYLIKGTHDVDKEWMSAVRNAGRERKLKSKSCRNEKNVFAKLKRIKNYFFVSVLYFTKKITPYY